MPSLRAWGQGSGAPAHLQVVQRPAGTCVSKGLHPFVADFIGAQVECLKQGQRPALNRLGESGEACVTNLVPIEIKLLRMAHSKKRYESRECIWQVSGHGDKAVGHQRTVNLSSAPIPASALSIPPKSAASRWCINRLRPSDSPQYPLWLFAPISTCSQRRSSCACHPDSELCPRCTIYCQCKSSSDSRKPPRTNPRDKSSSSLSRC